MRRMSLGLVLEDTNVDADSSLGNESLEDMVRAPLGRARPLAVVAPLAMDPGMWLNMVKSSYSEVDSMKKFILENKLYSQKCPSKINATIHA